MHPLLTTIILTRPEGVASKSTVSERNLMQLAVENKPGQVQLVSKVDHAVEVSGQRFSVARLAGFGVELGGDPTVNWLDLTNG
jgi:hypothetical protein